MDFDDDDPLDDLLRDAASSSSNRKAQNANSTSLFSDSQPPALVSSKKEKKSALLAELFGPPTSDLLDFPPPITTRSEESLNFKLEPKIETHAIEKATTDFSLGSYTPSLGSKPASAPLTKSIFQSDIYTSRTDSFQDSLPSVQKEEPVYQSPPLNSAQKSVFPSDIFTNQKDAFSDPVPSKVEETSHKAVSQNSGIKSVFPSNIFSSQVFNDSVPAKTGEATKPSILQSSEDKQTVTAQVPKRVLDTTNIEAVIEKFTERLCEELRRLAGKEDGFLLISAGLNRLAEIQSSHPQRTESDLEQRVSKLEATVDLLTTRVQSLDGCVSSQLEDVSRLKMDLENKLGKQMEIMQNIVDQKECSLMDKWQRQQREMESKQLDWERRMAESVCNSPKDSVNSEMAQILKGELKWLERQKNKLQHQRESNEKLRGIIDERFRQLSKLSEELQSTAGTLQCQQHLLNESLQKLDQKILKLNVKSEQSSSKMETVWDDPDQLKKIGVSLWKMHIQNDEATVAKQQQFLAKLLDKQN